MGIIRDGDFPRIRTDSVAEFSDQDGDLWFFPVWQNYEGRLFVETDSGMLRLEQSMNITVQAKPRLCKFTRYRKTEEVEAEQRASAAVAAPKPESVDPRFESLHVERIGAETQWQAARRAAEQRARQAFSQQRLAVREVQQK